VIERRCDRPPTVRSKLVSASEQPGIWNAGRESTQTGDPLNGRRLLAEALTAVRSNVEDAQQLRA
jgi:hypothetical protein